MPKRGIRPPQSRSRRAAPSAKRILGELLADALRRAGRDGSALKENLHQARRDLKKARAALRLARAELGSSLYRRENAEYRDLGRAFSVLRDAYVMRDTFRSLLSRQTRKALGGRFDSIGRQIEALIGRTVASALADKAGLERARSELRLARQRVGKLPLRGQGWKAVSAGLERVYRQGRKAFVQTKRDPADASFHEWRKAVKYLRYQLEMLADAFKNRGKREIEALHRLSDALGEEHDLVILREAIAKDPLAFGSHEAIDDFLAMIEERQARLRRRARKSGRRLYAEKPAAFVKRLRRYWTAAHA